VLEVEKSGLVGISLGGVSLGGIQVVCSLRRLFPELLSLL
jgi:hypothetical protein